MPKRSRIDESSSDALVQVSKRTKPGKDSDALQLILENADELISCLRELQSANKKRNGPSALKLDDLEGSSKEKISRLSQILSPAFQSLAGPSQDTSIEHKDATALTIPSAAMVTKWTVSTIDKSFPPLPAVLDPTLETAALTHPGMKVKLADPDYERLEWVGDAYIYIISTSLIYQTFPTLGPGKASQYREVLLKNKTLQKYAIHYGLDKRANFPPEFGLGGREGGTSASEKERMKARGDIFEAYVGALILSDPKNGVQRAADWLKSLWGQEIESEIRKHEKLPVVKEESFSAKTKLDALLSAKGIKIEYKDLPAKQQKDKLTNLPMFTVGCYLTGWGENMKKIGWGTALSKKDAGARAAQMALDNKKMLKVYTERKKAYLEARAAQEEELAAAKEGASDGAPAGSPPG